MIEKNLFVLLILVLQLLKTTVPETLFNKVAGLACNFIKKESLAQVLPCEFFEISKNTFFYRTPPVAVSKCLTSSAKFNEIVFDRCKSPVMPFCL